MMKFYLKTYAIKLICLFLAFLLTLSDLGYSDVLNVRSGSGQAFADVDLPVHHRKLSEISYLDALTLPNDLGNILAHEAGNGSRHVFHIQDLHINEATQLKIAEIVDYLSKRYQVKLIQLEGASGELSHHPLSLHPSKKARDLTAQAFLQNGFLTGTEYLAITRRPDLRLFGVEDAELYAKNRKALLEISRINKRDLQLIKLFEQKLKALGSIIFDEETREWLRVRDHFHQSPKEMMAYVHYLKNHCPSKEGDDCLGKQMKILLEIEGLEEKIDSQNLIKTLKEIDLSEASEEDRLSWIDFRENVLGKDQGVLRQHEKIVGTILPYLKADQDKEQLNYFIRFCELSAKIDLHIYDEIEATENFYEERLILEKEAQRLYQLHKILKIYENLFSLELTSEQASYLYGNRHFFEATWIENEIRSLSTNTGFDESFLNFSIKGLEEAVGLYESFYSYALSRDSKIVENAISAMESYEEEVTILITGGFHTAGIEKLLHEKNLGFTTVSPLISKSIDEDLDQKIYKKAMGLETSLLNQMIDKRENLMRDSKLQLQVPSRLANMSDIKANADLMGSMAGLEGLTLMMTTLSVVAQIFSSNEISERDYLRFEEMMTPEEAKFSRGVYGGFDSLGVLKKRESVRSGRLLLPPHDYLKYAVEAHWRPGAQSEKYALNASPKNRLEISFSGNIFMTMDFIHEPLIYKNIRSSYDLTEGRSELRSPDSLGGLNFNLKPVKENPLANNDAKFIRTALIDDDISDTLAEALELTAEDIEQSPTFSMYFKGSTVLKNGGNAGDAIKDKKGRRVLKLIVPKDGIRHYFILSENDDENTFTFRAYSKELNRLDHLLRNANFGEDAKIVLPQILGVSVENEKKMVVASLGGEAFESYVFQEEGAQNKFILQIRPSSDEASLLPIKNQKIYSSEIDGKPHILVIRPLEASSPSLRLSDDDGVVLAWVERNLETAAKNPEVLDHIARLVAKDYEANKNASQQIQPLELENDAFLKWVEENPDKVSIQSETMERFLQLARKEIPTTEEVVEESPSKYKTSSRKLPFYLFDLPLLLASFLSISKESVVLALLGIVLLRGGFLFALLVHEWGHLLAATGKGSWSFNNLKGNRSLGEWIRGLLPLSPLPTSASIQTEKASDAFFIRHAGWFGGGLYLSLLMTGFYFSPYAVISALIVTLFPGALAVFIKGFISDVFYPSESPCIHGCGNQGVLIGHSSKDKNLVSMEVEDILELMGRITKVRGEQAAGRVILTSDGLTQSRLVNKKRSDLAKALREVSHRDAKKNRSRGKRPAENEYLAMEHYRYGTSSAPHITETHPHIWTPERRRQVWTLLNKRLTLQEKNVSHAITHNGDFDSWELFGEQVPLQILALWLERVLDYPNDTEGDSPKIAGMMDFLNTQGRWDASIRFAYQMEFAESINDAFDNVNPTEVWEEIVYSSPIETSQIELKKQFNRRISKMTAPTQTQIDLYASLFEVIFKKQTAFFELKGLRTLSDIPATLREPFIREVKQALNNNENFRKWGTEKINRFVDTAVQAFFDHDTYNATQLFLSKAKGSFGLVTVSSLEPGKFVTAAQGQPISLGFYPERNLIAYASEATALKVPLSGGERIPYRLDLDQFSGEIVEVTLDGLKFFSRELSREITQEELEYSGRIIDMIDNPLVESLDVRAASKDPVGDDIRDIPKVVDQIRLDWKRRDSYNHRTAAAFVDQLKRKIDNPEEKAKPGELDILISGIEISQWLSEQMAADLRRVYPELNIESFSGNKILESIQKGSVGGINDHTIVLFLSQSGQTFPSLNAVTGLSAVYALEQTIPGRVFVMTGEMDTPLGAAIDQQYYKGAPFTERIFTNGSGRRSAEPSTVAAAAAYETLTELLLYIARDLPRVTGIEKPFGQKISVENLRDLFLIRDNMIDRGIVSIVGYTPRGDRVETKENKALLRIAKKWSNHILESAVAWGLSAFYVFVTVVFGVPLFSTAFGLLIAPYLSSISPMALLTGAYLFKAFDALLYIFLGYVISLGLRINPFQPRELFARTGKRGIVIGDLPYIHQSLEQFVSKLFSMSFGHASVDVHGANPRDHMLHRFGHRVVRGTLLFLGVPDGRLDEFKAAENNVLMTAKQGKGVRNLGVGAEVVTVGHRPINNPNAADEEILLWSHLDKVPDEAVVQALYDSRFASFERWISGFVFFHSIAKRVSKFFPLKYDMSRTQSGTRIATTAAPVSASEISDLLRRSTTDKSIPRILEEPTELPFKVNETKEEQEQVRSELIVEDSQELEESQEAVETDTFFQEEKSYQVLKNILIAQYESLVKGIVEKQTDRTGEALTEALTDVAQDWWKETRSFLSERELPESILTELQRVINQKTNEIVEQNRNELRRETTDSDFFDALDSMEKMRKTLQIQEVFDFAPYIKKLGEMRISLDDLFEDQDTRSLFKNSDEPETYSTVGEALLVYKDWMHSPSFVEGVSKKLKAEKGIKRLSIMRDKRTAWNEWIQLKDELALLMGTASKTVVFYDNQGQGSIASFVSSRLEKLGLTKSHALQIVAPNAVAPGQSDHYDKTLLAALTLGKDYFLVMGSDEPLEGVRSFSVGQYLRESFVAYRRIQVSA